LGLIHLVKMRILPVLQRNDLGDGYTGQKIRIKLRGLKREISIKLFAPTPEIKG
jgi:hypothetical protein